MFSTIMPAASALLFLMMVQQAPAEWDDTSRRAAQLLLDGKTTQAVPMLERAVAQAPGFDGAEYELAKAHHDLATQRALEGPSADAARKRHLAQAVTYFQRAAGRNGQYRQPALGMLMLVYGEDQLDDPKALADAARQYIGVDPGSAVGHATLVSALQKSGQDAAVWSALDAACAAVRAEDASALTRAILLQLTEAFPYVAPQSNPSPPPAGLTPKLLARLLEYAGTALDRELAKDPSDRQAISAKAAALLIRAQRLERDPARRKALEAEADGLLARNRKPSAAGAAPKEGASASAAPARPVEPAGYREASQQAAALVERKQFAQAAAIYEKFIASEPRFEPPHYLRVGALIRAGRSAEVEPALLAARKTIPATPESRHVAAAHLEEFARKNASIPPADAKRILAEALTLLDEALAMRPAYLEATVFKSLVLRGQARVESDPGRAKQLVAEADGLMKTAQAMMSKP